MINCMVGIQKKKKNKKKTDEESKEGRLGNLVFYIGDLWQRKTTYSSYGQKQILTFFHQLHTLVTIYGIESTTLLLETWLQILDLDSNSEIARSNKGNAEYSVEDSRM